MTTHAEQTVPQTRAPKLGPAGTTHGVHHLHQLHSAAWVQHASKTQRSELAETTLFIPLAAPAESARMTVRGCTTYCRLPSSSTSGT
jgi:hypothetical protein